MEFQVLIWAMGVLCVRIEAESYVAKKIVLQNEMSEHCRRRVVSSIFLGRQVAESSAKVMHFSRLEVPYSCSISVRTESGSNIILVILTKSEKSITSSCKEGHDQLLVYEMGETFGGYWGALPEYVFQQDVRNYSKFYTLKTTQSSEALLEPDDNGMSDYDLSNTTEDIITQTSQDETDSNYVMMEVPLVNVSGNLELGETELAHSEEDELFDLIYNVTPKNGVLYETSLLPLVQFSIWKQKGQNQGLEETEPRYQLDYNMQGFTPDYRLIFRTNNHRRKFSNRPYSTKRRRKFHKYDKSLFSVNNWPSRYQDIKKTHLNVQTRPKFVKELLPSTISPNGAPLDFTSFDNQTDTWQLIESYLKLLKVHNLTTSPHTESDKAMVISKKISNTKHNSSVYYSLQPNLLKYDSIGPSAVENGKTEKINNYNHSGKLSSSIPNSNFELQQNAYTINNLSLNDTSLYNLSIKNELHQTVLSNFTLGMAEVKIIEINTESTYSSKNVSNRKLTTFLPNIISLQDITSVPSTPKLKSQSGDLKNETTEKSRKYESGSLVDHESWENIVQVAPVMADLLNVTAPTTDVDTNFVSKKIMRKTLSSFIRMNRKKRYLKALSIERHRPRQLTTKEDVPTLDQRLDKIDSQHLAELVELQDDEIQGRVALHYYKNYVGSTIFNICDYQDVKVRQVYLFNSSRIVIAINNFTMDRITVVMTESRVARSTGCPSAHLECQVAGVRVCVHHMNACDGVPNCGAYDIYDEDRLLCGSNVGLHLTICLAACTFLVVLLTLLYTVHYWLKRCVPKVSQAFFVYTDKSENILYLDTIMRSPNDYDGGSRMVYHSSFFDDDELSADLITNEDSKFFSIIRRCLRFLFCKRVKRHSRDDELQQENTRSIYNEVRRKFSFPAAELRKISPINTINASVQTGESLEVAQIKGIRGSSSIDVSGKPCSTYGKKIYLHQSERELTTIRRVRGISASLQSSSKIDPIKKLEKNIKEHPVYVEEEIELRNTLYDREGKRPIVDRPVFKKTKREISSELPEKKRSTAKHLRFEEEATTIEPSAFNLIDDETNVDERYKVPLTTDRTANRNLDSIKEDDEVVNNSGRDFRSFWRGGKGKKDKKKTHLSLR